jgi:hypothetical protein
VRGKLIEENLFSVVTVANSFDDGADLAALWAGLDAAAAACAASLWLRCEAFCSRRVRMASCGLEKSTPTPAPSSTSYRAPPASTCTPSRGNVVVNLRDPRRLPTFVAKFATICASYHGGVCGEVFAALSWLLG